MRFPPFHFLKFNRLYLFVVYFLVTLTVHGQQDNPDSLVRESAISKAIAAYHAQSGEQAWLFNGIQYLRTPYKIEENAHFYFQSSALASGSIVYDNVFYDNLLLLHDEVTDQVIARDITNLHFVQLVASRISSFTIGNARFKRFEKNDSLSGGLQGFYQVLTDGQTSLLKKEIKTVREDVTSQGVLRYIDIRTSYHVRNTGKYEPVNSVKSLMKCFGSRKDEVRKHMKKLRIRFRSDKENYILTAITYYDQIH